MKRLVHLSLFMLLALAVSVPASGDDLQLTLTRTAPVTGWGEPNAAFGAAVAIARKDVAGEPVAGNYALVSDNRNGSGAIHLFKRSGTEWTRLEQAGWVLGGSIRAMDFDGERAIISTQYESGSSFVFIMRFNPFTERLAVEGDFGSALANWGQSVSIDGHFAVIGAPPSTVRPLRYNTGTQQWEQMPLLASGAQSLNFGASVSLRRARLAVGDPGASFRGRVRIWRQEAGAWVFEEQIEHPDGTQNTRFGAHVALHGEVASDGFISHRLLIGAPRDRAASGPEDMGRAYLYSRVQGGSQFVRLETLSAPTPVAGDNFGDTVAMDNGYLLVGAPGRNGNRGAVFAARVSSFGLNSAWTTIVDGQGAAGDLLGTALSISDSGSGPRWLVGSALATANGNEGQGITLMGTGTQAAPFPGTVRRVDLGQGLYRAMFGYSISVHGGSVVVGAQGQNIGSDLRRGAVYVYADIADVNTPPLQILAPDGQTGDLFGARVSHNSQVLAISAPWYRNQSGWVVGAVYVYRPGANGAWALDTILRDPMPMQWQHFGRDVAVLADGSVVVLTENPSRIRRFSRQPDGFWTSHPQCDVFESGIDGMDHRIVADGLRLAYAMPNAGGGGLLNQGIVEIFELVFDQTSNCMALGTFRRFFGNQANQRLGTSVSLDGDRIAILSQAQPNGLNQGRVEIHRRVSQESWLPEASFPVTPLAPPASGQALRQIALRGDSLAISSHTHVDTLDVLGAVFVYRRDGEQWQPRQTLGATALESNQAASFFDALAWLGSDLIVGAWDRNLAFRGQGVVQLLRSQTELFANGFE